MQFTAPNETIRSALASPEYDFLSSDPRLGDHIILLTLGGSYAYGTNIATSDIDIRGVALNSRENLLTMHDFDKVEDKSTDTVVYSLDKAASLMADANPNMLEILYCRPEDYLYLSDEGRLLIRNRDAFLSKHVIEKFGGYASSQLHSIEKLTDNAMLDELEQQILKRMERLEHTFREKYSPHPDDGIRLYIDGSEIFMDLNLTHYPIRDYCNLWNEMKNIVKQYQTVGKRNRHAILHDKLAKHMMHLVRLYCMCFDILQTGTFCTHRDKDHDLLMAIRGGCYLDKNDHPTPEFYEKVHELDEHLHELSKTTTLPEEPDIQKIRKLVMGINEKTIENNKKMKF